MKMPVALCLLVLMFSIPPASRADQPTPDLAGRVQALSAPALAGRGSGVPEAEAVSDLLAGWLQELALEPAFDKQWFQEFTLKGEGWHGEDLTGLAGRNVAGVIRGKGELADRFIVLGAHFDHLGRLDADPATGEPAADGYYPGANDNASGVAAVIQVARALASMDQPASCRSVLVIFFAAEEVGLQGSAHFVVNPSVSLDLVDTMINFDTVGQMTDNRLHVSGIGTAAELPALVAAANTGNLDLSLAQGGWSGSDHMSFNTREVPVLFLFGGPYMQYNTPRDTWDTLNYQGLQAISDYALQLVSSLRTIDSPLQWTMVAEAELRPDDSVAQNRDSWLGTLPDFTEEVSGYKLAGVFAGSPAARAGLLKGDVMIGMAGRQVTDLATFTRALRSAGPGDLVEIKILREGKPLNFTVVLGDRKDRK
jgi:hypothetical protein